MRRKKHKSIEKRKEYRKIRKLVRIGFEAQADALEERLKQSNSLTEEQLSLIHILTYARAEIERQLYESLGKRVQVRILADLLEIRDEKWRNAIEGFLAWNKLALICLLYTSGAEGRRHRGTGIPGAGAFYWGKSVPGNRAS